MFLSNGETEDIEDTTRLIAEASYEPIFWQFITLGITKEDMGGGFWGWIKRPFAEDYSFLQKLDDLEDRFIDNADFFNVSNPKDISDVSLYRKLMTEYPDWLKEAKEKGLIQLTS
jgi:hypothetical protein